MTKFNHLSGALFFALTLMIGSSAAQAVPQALAVAATSSPIEFVCKNGVCEVELSSMCLQYEKRFPDPRTAYYPTDKSAFTLMLKKQNGETIQVPASKQADIRATRTYTAVTIKIDEQWLIENDVQQASLVVAKEATLLPIAVAGDFTPQTDADIEKTKTYLRPLVDNWLEGDKVKRQRMTMLNRLINRTSRSGTLTSSESAEIWEDAISGAPASVTAPVREHVSEIFRQCQNSAGSVGSPALRRCLEMSHDTAIYQMNIEFWNASKAGS